jgi:phosphatidylserine decarboxylase
MDSLFILLQHVAPQHLLSRFTGWLAELRHPVWLKNWVIRKFVDHFGVDMSEAREPNTSAYANFNEFFTRALRDDARAISGADVVCPADGAISQIGAIEDGRIFQAKGHSYTVRELLAGDDAEVGTFREGCFVTIYLSPRDYHRVHMPLAGSLSATRYVPGKLFSVNGTTAENVERLFARNERLICLFDTAAGPMALVLVGAMVVAGIETVWSGQEAPPRRDVAATRDFRSPPAPVDLDKGQEMGRFRLGSTVILLFPRGAVEWDRGYGAGSPTRLGEPLASLARAQRSPPTGG